MMHIISVPKSGFGQTAFISSSLAIDEILNHENNRELKVLLNKLYFIGTSPNYAIHPVIYKHPVTQKQTMLIHLGMTSSFIEINDKYKHLNIQQAVKLYQQTDEENKGDILKIYTTQETQSILDKIQQFIEKCKEKDLMYKHEYCKGDLIITDNLALLHEAVPSTQFKVNQIGLRIMDRISIGDLYKPTK